MPCLHPFHIICLQASWDLKHSTKQMKTLSFSLGTALTPTQGSLIVQYSGAASSYRTYGLYHPNAAVQNGCLRCYSLFCICALFSFPCHNALHLPSMNFVWLNLDHFSIRVSLSPAKCLLSGITYIYFISMGILPLSTLMTTFAWSRGKDKPL